MVNSISFEYISVRECDKISLEKGKFRIPRLGNTRNAASVGGMLDLISEASVSSSYFNYPLVNLWITGGYGCPRFTFVVVGTNRWGRGGGGEFRDAEDSTKFRRWKLVGEIGN